MSSLGDGGSTQTAVQSNEPWSGVAPYLTQGYGDASTLYNQGAQQYYPGKTYAPANTLEHTANEQRLGYAQNQLPGQIGQAQGALTSMYNAPDIGNNPYVQNLAQAANRRIGDDFQQYVMPGIRTNAQGMGQFGSSRQGIAEGLAAGRASQAMADSTAALYSGAYNKGLDQQYRGLTSAQGVADLGFMPSTTTAQAGQFIRGEEEMALQDDISRYNFGQNADWNNLSKYLGAIGNAPWSSSSQSSTDVDSNLLGQALGLGMAGTSLYDYWK